MYTYIEACFDRLHQHLKTAAAGSEALPTKVSRNETLRDLFGQIAAGGVSAKAYLNLIDDDGDIYETIIGHDSDYEDEIGQKASIEWIVMKTDPQERDRVFDAGVAAIANALRGARTDKIWDDLEIITAERANLSTGPLPFVKAMRITVEMLLTQPDLLGQILSERKTGFLEPFLGSGRIELAPLLSGEGLIEPLLSGGEVSLLIQAQAGGWLEPLLGSGSLGVTGQLGLSGAMQLAPLLGAGEVGLVIAGVGAGTLDPLLGAGVIGSGISGDSAAMLAPLLGAGEAVLLVSAASAGQLDPFLGAGQLGQSSLITGESAGSLDPLLGAGDGEVALQATSAAQIEPLLGAGEAAVSIAATGGGVIAPFIGAGDAAALVQASGGGVIAPLLGAGDASVASAGGNEPETDALLARMTVAPDGAREARINQLIGDLKTAGIWSELDYLHLIAAHDEQAGQRNWIKDAHNIATLGAFPGSFVTDQGYANGDGGTNASDCLTANFGDGSTGRQMTAGSMSWGVFMLSNPTAETFASFYFSTNRMQARHTVGEIRIRGQSFTEMVVDPNNQAESLYALTDDGVTETGYHNGVAGPTNASSGNDIQGDLYLLASSFTNADNALIAANFGGAHLTGAQMAQLDTLVRGYLTDIGAIT